MKRADVRVGRAGSRMKRSTLRGMRISAFIGLPSLVRASCSAMREAEIGDERERMRRIDRERRQHREDLVEEMVLEPGRGRPCCSVVARRPARCSARRSSLAQLAPARLLVAGQRSTPPRRCARAARSGVRPSGLFVAMPARTWPLRPATRTMKNSSRLLARDRQEAQPLEQRMVGVLGLLQHAAIELQPGQLAIDEAVGNVGDGEARLRPCGGPPPGPARRRIPVE